MAVVVGEVRGVGTTHGAIRRGLLPGRLGPRGRIRRWLGVAVPVWAMALGEHLTEMAGLSGVSVAAGREFTMG